MKAFYAIFLFVAFVAHIHADETEDLFAEDVNDDSDKSAIVQCKIDLRGCVKAANDTKAKMGCLKTFYKCVKKAPLPTLPPFVGKCNGELKTCLKAADGMKQKVKCLTGYAKCIRGGLVAPTAAVQDSFVAEFDDVAPTDRPSFQCTKAMYSCIKEGTKSKLECMKDYKNCLVTLVPTMPNFVTLCNNDLSSCVSHASGIQEQGACYLEYAKCLKNKGPTPVTYAPDSVVMDDVVPTDRPSFQCTKAMYSCIKEGTKSKLECMKDYKNCLVTLVPTMPNFVTLCNNDLSSCVSHASGIQEQGACYLEYAKCLKNKGPTPVTYAPDSVVMDDVVPTDRPSFQCTKAMYSCIKEGIKGKLECMKDYKNCLVTLVPTMPNFVALCNNDLSSCVSHASGIQEQGACYLEYAKCLKNQGPTPVTYAPDSVVMDEPMEDGAETTRDPLMQCQIDLYDCNNKGDKTSMECLTDYKTCMTELIPPYVETCKQEAEKCYNSASGILDKAQCAADFAVCIKNKGPSQA